MSILNTVGKVFEKIVYDAIYPVIVKEFPTINMAYSQRVPLKLILYVSQMKSCLLCKVEGVIYTDF